MELKKLEKLRKPYKDTLWSYCLWKEIEIAKEKGWTEVQFDKVDRRVIEMSKEIEWPIKGEENGKEK